MIKNNAKVFALASCLAFSSVALAWQTPNSALHEFLRFELGGGRLSAWDYAKYLAAKPGYEEPVWDQVELIRKAKIQSIDCTDTWCVANVLLIYEATQGLKSTHLIQHPYGGHRVEQYRIRNVRGQWLVETPKGYPLVSFPAFQKAFTK